jgi:hypothetical protein
MLLLRLLEGGDREGEGMMFVLVGGTSEEEESDVDCPIHSLRFFR